MSHSLKDPQHTVRILTSVKPERLGATKPMDIASITTHRSSSVVDATQDTVVRPPRVIDVSSISLIHATETEETAEQTRSASL